MDMITESLLAEFSKEHSIQDLDKDDRFEHFAAYITVRRQHAETFDTSDLVVGDGDDSSIDAFAAIVNGTLIADLNDFEDIAEGAGYLEAVFVFVQATQSPTFDGARIGNFGYGVGDFFSPTPSLRRNSKVSEAAELVRAIYARGSKFRRGNPQCKLYFVTTGRWSDDPNLLGRVEAVKADLGNLNIFSTVDFYPVGAEGIQKLYRQSKNAISREFDFPKRTTVPAIKGVADAYIGLISASEALTLLRDEDGEITKGIFYDNVRDWQGFQDVNNEIRQTLESENKARFALMNNGITIIARHLQPTGDRFHIEDFQIVNGCQTSHVLFEVAKDVQIDPSVMIPLRLISTQDEDVIRNITRATNRQTEVTEEQFFALTEFPRQLEAFFETFQDGKRLYYERRSRQYDSVSTIEKTRVVTQVNLTRAFAAMFLGEPHTVTRSYKTIRAKISTEIFEKGHKPHPYYTAAYALYRLEFLFRAHRIDTKYKKTRYHILYALRMLVNPNAPPPKNSKDMESYCQRINEALWDTTRSDELFVDATRAIDQAASALGRSWETDRDAARTLPFTEQLRKACGVMHGV